MPRKNKQQIVGEFRRASIIEAARTVFARHGFARGIMDEVAREAGIAKGTVYLYFNSKTEIYKAVLEHDISRLQEITLARLDAAATLKEKLAAFTLTRLENAESRKAFFRIMDSVQENLSMTRRQYRELLREPVGRMTHAIEQAIELGEIRSLPAEKTAWVIADMTRGAIQRRLLGHCDTTPAEDAAFLLDLIWAAISSPAASSKSNRPKRAATAPKSPRGKTNRKPAKATGKG